MQETSQCQTQSNTNGNNQYGLTNREIEILGYVQENPGITLKALAGFFGVKLVTIQFHLGSVYRKTGSANRAEAIKRTESFFAPALVAA